MAKKKIYRFKGTEGASMPEALIKKWIQKHQDHHIVKGHFFGRDIINKILGQPGCMGIRIYHAINDNAEKTLVLIGADDRGKDMWPSDSSGKGKLKGGGNTVGDQAVPCPPNCP
jgi:hypothetical protein